MRLGDESCTYALEHLICNRALVVAGTVSSRLRTDVSLSCSAFKRVAVASHLSTRLLTTVTCPPFNHSKASTSTARIIEYRGWYNRSTTCLKGRKALDETLPALRSCFTCCEYIMSLHLTRPALRHSATRQPGMLTTSDSFITIALSGLTYSAIVKL